MLPVLVDRLIFEDGGQLFVEGTFAVRVQPSLELIKLDVPLAFLKLSSSVVSWMVYMTEVLASNSWCMTVLLRPSVEVSCVLIRLLDGPGHSVGWLTAVSIFSLCLEF